MKYEAHLFPCALLRRIVLDHTGKLGIKEALTHSIFLGRKLVVKINHKLLK